MIGANDPSTADCLGILLDEQAIRLRALATRMADSVARARLDGAPTPEWSGLAREARDRLAGLIRLETGRALIALDRAVAESRQGATTLAIRG
jgi:hypothetical protein